jgi:transcriptional regulator with GAF, ATPase, and Fis domain
MKDTLPSTLGSLDLESNSRGPVYALQIIGAAGVLSRTLQPGQTVRIGRRRESDIIVEHPGASREHAIIYGGDPPSIEDLGSSNGTKVQGNRIASNSRISLPAGSVVEVAGTIVHVRRGSALPADEDSQHDAKSVTAGTKRRRVVMQDRRMTDLYALAERVAASSMSVLVLGETGAGKELLAEHLHVASPRRDRPFLRVNCAALAEGVLASELFGHEKGAFTGAHATKIGLFETANGGTVFLDEIGELSQETQAKLLRVLETGEVTRVGSHQPRQIDVRIVSATNRDLRELTGRGRFRSDLFFRLNGVSLVIPPLRDRPLDIIALAEFFVDRCAAMMTAAPPVLSEDAKTLLLRYRWPGNVRELKNAIERAVVLTPGSVLEASSFQLDFAHHGGSGSASTIPVSATGSGAVESSALLDRLTGGSVAEPSRDGARLGDALDRGRGPRSSSAGRFKAARRTEQLRAELHRAERERILEALQQAGNQAGAAKLLGISRRALIYRLEAYDIPRPRKGGGDSGSDS